MADNSIYYSSSRARSYGCSFNLIVGPRGPGKTFDLTKYCISRFLRDGSEFKWVRRYPKEVKEVKQKFFNDMIANEVFKGHELTAKNGKFYVDDKYAGSVIALSTADDLKSSPEPNCQTIVFDEFIIEKGFRHYLPDEVHTFLNLVNSIVRRRSGWSVWLLANAVTMANPYFDFWNVRLPFGKDIARVNKHVLIEYVQNAAYEAAVNESQFGQAIAGTAYADYAVKNRFYLDNPAFIDKKSQNAQYYFTIRYNKRDYGVYADFKTGILYVSADANPVYPVSFALTNDDHSPNTLIVRGRRNPYIDMLLKCYDAGAVRFESQKIKSVIINAVGLFRR